MNKRQKKKKKFIRPKQVQMITLNEDDILVFTFPRDMTAMEMHHAYKCLANTFPNNTTVAVEHGTDIKVISKGEFNELQSIQNSNEETVVEQTYERA